MSVKIGDKLEATIDGVDEKGPRSAPCRRPSRGFAYFTIPGEKICGEVTARRGGELRVRVETIIEPSKDRVVPQCPMPDAVAAVPLQMIQL